MAILIQCDRCGNRQDSDVSTAGWANIILHRNMVPPELGHPPPGIVKEFEMHLCPGCTNHHKLDEYGPKPFTVEEIEAASGEARNDESPPK